MPNIDTRNAKFMFNNTYLTKLLTSIEPMSFGRKMATLATPGNVNGDTLGFSGQRARSPTSAQTAQIHNIETHNLKRLRVVPKPIHVALKWRVRMFSNSNYAIVAESDLQLLAMPSASSTTPSKINDIL
ncbi:hypothetical protein [Serratia quinivorans]|jgi:hypothetical protein|uniref:hypothetical protein n=1 Tax=Serratia quinivorans TaxID=137545 RepID=UPI0021BDD4AB|nr:hypothetical protein [Serratia quinivorans]